MIREALIDTGPLVAVLRTSDNSHDVCKQMAATIQSPPLTTWPVITEAAYLLRSHPQHVDKLLEFVSKGIVSCVHISSDAATWIATFMAKYGELQPQLADASLMYLAKTCGIRRVFTLDKRDFSVFRLEDGSAMEVIP